MFSAHGMTLGKAIAEERLEYFARCSQNAGRYLDLDWRMPTIVYIQDNVAEVADGLCGCLEYVLEGRECVFECLGDGLDAVGCCREPINDCHIWSSHVAIVAVAACGCVSVVD